MEPPNRNTMGSRAGPSLSNNLGKGNNPPQTRLGTKGGLNPTTAGGVGIMTNIDIVNRPITGGGIGVNNLGTNLGRQVYDKNYYINRLKQKLQTIYIQIQNFKKKGDDITKQQQLYNKLQTRFEDLKKQVRNLEGQLADYNLAIDKLRVNTRPEDVKNAYHHVKNQNDKFKAELDQVFLQRKKYEQEIQRIQNELQNIHRQMELRLNELDPYQRNQYQKLINQNKELINQYNVKQRDLEELNNRLGNAQAKLRMDSQKLKGQLLKDQINELETKKSDLQIQLNEANLSIPEARDRILARMKEDNNTIINTEKRTKEIKKNIEIYQKKLRDLQASLLDKKTQEQDKKKYQILYQKDKQMDQFISSFEKNRQNEFNQINQVQQRVTELLEQITKILQISGQLPSRQSITTQKFDKNKNTIAQAKTQYQMRLNNLRGLQSTQTRTKQQIQDLQQKIRNMKKEIGEKYQKVDKFKEDLYKKKEKLLKDQKELESLKVKSSTQASKIQYDYNILEKKFQMHEIYGNYSEIEKKLSQQEAQKYYMKSYINIKSKDMKYQNLKDECIKYCEQLNKTLQK